MCEIATLGSSYDSITLLRLAKDMYKQNNDGLGIVGIYREDDSFNYSLNKSVNPQWSVVYDLFNTNSPWRWVIHARLTTSGGNGWAETHPIKIIDDDVGFDFVVHNGHVMDNGLTERFERQGHDINTPVDSELIAHAHKEMPESLSDDNFDEPTISGNLNYLLFNEDGILVRNSGKYHLKDDLVMTCRNSNVDGNHKDDGFTLFYPDGTVDKTDIAVSGYNTHSTNHGKASQAINNVTYGNYWSRKESDDSNDTYRTSYSKYNDYSDYKQKETDSDARYLRKNNPSYWHTYEHLNTTRCEEHQESFKQDNNEVCPMCLTELKRQYKIHADEKDVRTRYVESE